MSRKIVSDFGSFEDAKIILDDENNLVMRAVIASEIVHAYPEGMAYKPADELEKAAWTANGRWVKVLSHPAHQYINSRSDINGQMENARFRRDLLDPKTKRPCRRGIEVDVRWFKDRTPKDVLEQARNLTLRESSIGFTCINDPTPGEFQGQHYDFVQRDICIDHLAAPIARGRCPSPYCGIAVDSVDVVDMWEENDNSIRSGHGDVNSFDANSFRTIDITSGIKAVVGCPKGKYDGGKCTVGMQTQSFIFDKTKFTMAQAKAWFNKHQDSAAEDLAAFYSCPVCRTIDEVGLLTVGQRLYKQYGADVLEVIEGHELPGTAADASDADKQAQIARSKKYGIAIKEGGNVTKPKDYANVPDEEFADPVNYRYPLDAGRVQAAWSYWNQPKNQEQYSSEERAKITERIKAAMKKHGHKVADSQDSADDVILANRRALQSLISRIEHFS